MLVIRDQQMEALRLSKVPALRGYVTAMLLREAPEVFSDASIGETGAFVAKGCDQAMSHGFLDAYLIGQYVLFMAWAGEDLDTRPWAAAILSDGGMSLPAKIGALEDHILSGEAEA